jgi:iron complex outermembrane receptor protein
MIRLCWSSVIASVIASISLQCFSQESEQNSDDSFSEFATWEEKTVLGEELPMVLTAARLKQPKAEVPASVTVITSEQIKLWGVRTLPELMKFVPGMFVGHGDQENNRSVAYHMSNPNMMRRLQVTIDGRSVYKAAIATVIWDDIGLSLEDIDRIEVVRGPNAALYGANSYLGIINIQTKHPEDSQGTLVSWRKGNKGTQDVHFRHGLSFDSTSLRISGSVKADEGFDGRDSSGSDNYRDGRKHGFINASLNHKLNDENNIAVQLGYKSGKTEMRELEFDQSPPDKTTSNGYAYARWEKDFSGDHKTHLQAYWQKDELKKKSDVCSPTLAFGDDIAQLYKQNSNWAEAVTFIPILYAAENPEPGFSRVELEGLVNGLRAGVVGSNFIQSNLGFSVSQNDLDLTQTILNKTSDPSLILNEYACGNTDFDLSEQRIDIEWQDTMRWSDKLRTVAGVSYRQDSANSQTYFNGNVQNDTWRTFANVEYRANSWMIFNAGGMYEYEAYSYEAFSPKAAVNFLIDSQQSIRLVASQAHRSPDLLENQHEYIVNIKNLTDNYQGLTQANYFQQNIAGENSKSLKPEKISSYEVGYFVSGDFKGVNTEFDLKIFREEMRDMISDPMTLGTDYISNDNEADVNGFELQLLSRLNHHHSVLATYSHLDIDSRYVGDRFDEEERLLIEKREVRLSSEGSTVLSWMYNSSNWSASLSYFNQDRKQINKPYERFQLNISKPFVIAGLNAEVSYYIQHNRQPDTPLIYTNQKYSTPNVYYGQLAIEF